MIPFDYLEIKEMQCASTDRHYLVCYGDIYLEANQVMVDLLQCLAKENTIEAAVHIYTEKYNNSYSQEQLVEYIKSVLLPRFDAIDNKKKKNFLWQKNILSPVILHEITKKVSCLFCKPCILLIIVISAILDVLFFCKTSDLLNYSDFSNLYVIISLVGCMLFSSFFHELGHAAACSYYGVQHGSIGIGLYLTFPVLYTDVNDAWKLPRHKRCIVNFGGVYFQSIILSILLIIYFITEFTFLKYVILMINVGFAFVLNPFLKFDGYWIVSDMLGIPNLRKRANESVKYYSVPHF